MNDNELSSALERLVADRKRLEAPAALHESVWAIPDTTRRRHGRLAALRTSASLAALRHASELVVAGVVVAVFGGVVATGLLATRQGPEESSAGAAATDGAAARSPSPANDLPEGEPYLRGSQTLTIHGIPLSFTLPKGVGTRSDWEGFRDDLYISNDTELYQDAEAIILWTTFPDSHPARPCLLEPSAGASAADLAAAVASAPGTKLVSGPSDVTVGGRAAKQVVLTVTFRLPRRDVDPAPWQDLGCNPAYFFGWEASNLGAFWNDTLPGDTIEVWIVDVDGVLLFIEAETQPDAGPAVEQEIQDIIDSIRFE